MIKAVLFDLDGTLIDSPNIIMTAFEAAVIKHSNHVPTNDEKTSVLGMTLPIAFKPYVLSEEHYLKMVETFREVSAKNTLIMLNAYRNAKNVIQYLRNKGYLVGIVTSKNREIVLQNLKQTNLDNLFDCIVTSDDTNIHKPNPEPLLLALNILNVNPSNAIYIGDHENDIKAGNNANMRTGLMEYSHRLNEAKAFNPTYIFSELNNIIEIL